ncbi:STAS domain-containing protein [Fictibacillus nanhaiensis]|uniref:STAS domain-containing protein n=1 Tax=Fictibacillus nanhaiensis TaxID=742169 RepID=UPI001C94BCE2|nr:STAS domain-containing protein [Fictibacillus nanhaiensis]MBY6035043.1 STAS domain-containing protein [Fictibacillus nanhaiensis]
MPELFKLGQLLIDDSLTISKNINKKLDTRYSNFIKESDLEDDEVTNWRRQLIILVGEAVLEGSDEIIKDRLNEWAYKTGEGAVAYGIAIDELLKTNKVYREVFWEYIETHLESEVSVKKLLSMNRIIDSILAQTAYIFSVSFVKFHQKTLQQARDALLDISTPVVSITEDVAILPLVGDLDTYRAKLLMENSLKQCMKLNNRYLVIDLSGVPIVDTLVANELFQINKALNLIGVKTIFTGIRPDIAQTVVSLGIDFNDIAVSSNLKNALSTILKWTSNIHESTV